MKNADNKNTIRDWSIGAILIVAITVVAVLVMNASQAWLFPEEYEYPDYNHSASLIAICLIAVVAICGMFFVYRIKRYRGWAALIVALGGTAIILPYAYTLLSEKEYYYYDNEYNWTRRNSFRMKGAYPVGYNNDGTVIFGNTLAIQHDTTKIGSRNNEIGIFQTPVVFFKNSRVDTRPYMCFYVEDLPRSVAFLCEDTTRNEIGVLDGYGNEFIKPGQYQEVNMYKYKHHIKVRQNDKWGVVNLKGKLVIPCSYKYVLGLEYGFDTYFDGGFLVAFPNEDEFVMIDTLGRSLSYEQYHSLYPKVTIERCSADSIYIKSETYNCSVEAMQCIRK